MIKSHPMYRTFAIFIALLLVVASVFLLFVPTQKASAEVVQNSVTFIFADVFSFYSSSSKLNVWYIPLVDSHGYPISVISNSTMVPLGYNRTSQILIIPNSISFSISHPYVGNARLNCTITFLSDSDVSSCIKSDFGGEIVNNTWSGPWYSQTVNFEVLSSFTLTGITLSYYESFLTSSDLDDAFYEGYDAGKQAGYDEGYSFGRQIGFNDANSTINEGSASWTAGYNKGIDDSGKFTFYSLIGAVIDVPIQTLTSLLNFEFLGINMLSFFTSIFTLLVSIVIAKFVIGFFL